MPRLTRIFADAGADVLLPREADLEEQEPGLHEEHEDRGDDHPGRVELLLHRSGAWGGGCDARHHQACDQRQQRREAEPLCHLISSCCEALERAQGVVPPPRLRPAVVVCQRDQCPFARPRRVCTGVENSTGELVRPRSGALENPLTSGFSAVQRAEMEPIGLAASVAAWGRSRRVVGSGALAGAAGRRSARRARRRSRSRRDRRRARCQRACASRWRSSRKPSVCSGSWWKSSVRFASTREAKSDRCRSIREWPQPSWPGYSSSVYWQSWISRSASRARL